MEVQAIPLSFTQEFLYFCLEKPYIYCTDSGAAVVSKVYNKGKWKKPYRFTAFGWHCGNQDDMWQLLHGNLDKDGLIA